jgi:hypothetical protein
MSSTEKKPRPATSVVTDEGRFFFVTINEPRAAPNSTKLKYSIQFAFPKSNKALKKRLDVAIQAAKEVGKTSAKAKWNGVIPPVLKLPIRDGDMEKPDRPEYAGMWFMSCNSDNKPKPVDANLQPIMNATDIYSGCYGRLDVNFYPFGGANKGIAVGLNNVQKLRDGEPLSGGSSAEAAFGGEDNDDL